MPINRRSPRPFRRVVFALSVAVLLVGGAGCTGSSDSADSVTTTTEVPPSTTTTAVVPPEAQAFVSAANVICADRNDLIAHVSMSSTVSGTALVIERTVDFGQKAQVQLRALTIPPGAEQVVADLLTAKDEILALSLQEAAAIRAGDITAAKALDEQITEKDAALDEQLRAFGLVDCAA